jgi:OOP family OmpA-OmpF porin
MHDYKLTLQTNTQEALIKHPYAFSVAVGLRYSFGDNGKKIPVVVPPKVDSDRDGVEDKYDTCAQTPPGVIVDVNGCELDTDEDGIVNSQDSCPATPIGLAVDKQGCLLDFDQDGVVNTLDKCDDTPARVSVDEQGCPVDEDKDGIADFQDLCLLTPSGFSVDENGCEKAFILKITFASNSFVIEKEYYHEIQKFVSFLNAFPEYDTVVEAHTDSIGTQEGNNILSYKRAKSVYKELVKMGIQASRITYKGMGSQAPIASNETEEGKQLNRRIEAILIKKER